MKSRFALPLQSAATATLNAANSRRSSHSSAPRRNPAKWLASLTKPTSTAIFATFCTLSSTASYNGCQTWNGTSDTPGTAMPLRAPNTSTEPNSTDTSFGLSAIIVETCVLPGCSTR